MGYLIRIATPEPTDPPQVPAGRHGNRILGLAKASVWVAVSIGIGITLATVCH